MLNNNNYYKLKDLFKLMNLDTNPKITSLEKREYSLLGFKASTCEKELKKVILNQQTRLLVFQEGLEILNEYLGLLEKRGIPNWALTDSGTIRSFVYFEHFLDRRLGDTSEIYEIKKGIEQVISGEKVNENRLNKGIEFFKDLRIYLNQKLTSYF